MQQFTPGTPQELAEILRAAAEKKRSIHVAGRSSKNLMGGPIVPYKVFLQTTALRKVLHYERGDLTISVEAGVPFSELQGILAENGQMIALDPPLASDGTVGGILATNNSGPMRRQYGTARDLVIGMTFATVEGKLVKAGGMVVKNVAGLDMGKLMIGSFGTLAVIASANFRVHPLPPETRTFLLGHKDAASALQARNQIQRGVLQPLSMDLLTPPASTRLGLQGYLLAVQAGGSPAVLARYSSEIEGATVLAGKEEIEFWSKVRDFAPDFMKRTPRGVVLRISTPMQDLAQVLRLVTGPCVARAASGVSYACFSSWQSVSAIWEAARQRGWSIAVESASDEIRSSKDLLLASNDAAGTGSFGMMEKVKSMFDPGKLLNRSRFYGRI